MEGPAVLFREALLFMTHIDDVLRAQATAPGANKEDHRDLLGLVDWVMHFVLLFFRLVLATQKGDDLLAEDLDFDLDLSLKQEVKMEPEETSSVSDLTNPILAWTTDLVFLERLKSLMKSGLKLHQAYHQQTGTAGFTGQLSNIELTNLWKALEGLLTARKNEPTQEVEPRLRQAALETVQKFFPKHKLQAWSEIHTCCTSRLGLIVSGTDTTLLEACLKPNKEPGLPPLRGSCVTVEPSSVPFDVVTLCAITKDPLRQCTRCFRVTAVPTESEEAWHPKFAKGHCPVCRGDWRSLVPTEES